MGRSKAQIAEDAGPPPDRSKDLAAAQAEEAGHRERAAKLLDEKKGLQTKLFESDRKAEAGVKEVLDGFPQGETSELVAKVLELRDPGRTEKKEAIERLGLAIEMENRKATECRLRAKKLEEEIEEVAKDVACRAMYDAVLAWIEKFKVIDGQRRRLFEQANQCGFRDFAKRMQAQGLKGATVIGSLCESYLKPERIDEMSTSALATAVEDLSKAYGVTMLGEIGRPHGDLDVPMHRENYFAGYGTPSQMMPKVDNKRK
jgi:hypothetical protein